MTVADLTREEARERTRLLRIESYEVEVDFTRGDKEFGSTSVVRFSANTVGADTFVDIIAERIHSATLNGEPVDLTAYADGRLPLRGLAAENTLVVTADCAYTHESAGVHRAVDQANGKVYLYTHLYPSEARRVFANFDQLDLKATFAYTVIAPDHWLVLSDSPTPTPEPIPAPASGRSHTARWQFAPTPRLSTYPTAIVAGEYEYVRQSFRSRRGRKIQLGLACRASLAEYLEPADVFEITGQGLDYYTELFDMDFPFAKYDQVFVPEFRPGAMENAGCVALSETFLFRDKVGAAGYEHRARVLLHEMAHMWFGNLVTMRWWGDVWLNESFADLCSVYATAEATRFSDAWVQFSAGRKTWGYEQDQLPSTHPIVAEAPSLSSAIGNFDGISYAKGASVLKQLVAHVGRERFFAGIRAYLTEHAWANAEFADLVGALEKASGQDLRDWAAVWLETAGPNLLQAEFEVDDTGRYSRFAVRQSAIVPGHPTLRPHRISIGFYNRTDESLSCVRRARIDVDAAALTEVPALVGTPRADVVLLNDDDAGFVLTRFDDDSLHTLSPVISTLPDPLSRSVAWTALLRLLDRAELSVEAFVRIVDHALPDEVSLGLLQALLSAVHGAVPLLAGPAHLPALNARLAATAHECLLRAEPGGDVQLAWAQAFIRLAAAPEQFDQLEALLTGAEELAGLAIGTVLRWELLYRLVAAGRAGDAEIDAELARDATDDGARQAQRARAAVPDAEHKAAAWALLTESDDLGLGPQSIRAVAAGFNALGPADLMTPYVDKYFAYLPQLWATRSWRARNTLAELLFPTACASPELLDRTETYLADPDLDPALRRVLVEAADTVGRILRSRAL